MCTRTHTPLPKAEPSAGFLGNDFWARMPIAWHQIPGRTGNTANTDLDPPCCKPTSAQSVHELLVGVCRQSVCTSFSVACAANLCTSFSVACATNVHELLGGV